MRNSGRGIPIIGCVNLGERGGEEIVIERAKLPYDYPGLDRTLLMRLLGNNVTKELKVIF